MKVLLYNLGIRLYLLMIHLASPFSKKARLWIEGRDNYFRLLQSRMYKNNAPVIWFHCASLGEFEQSRPLIERVKIRYPEYNIFLTFFSPSGYEIIKNYEYADYVFYMPLDTAFNARKFIRVVNPRLALFVKYEFWYHFLSEMEKKNIPVISFSAIFREDKKMYGLYKGFLFSILKKFKMIFVQDDISLDILKRNHVNNAIVAGDTRFDRVVEIWGNRKAFPLVEKFKGSEKLFIAGSTWTEDMKLLTPLINDTHYNMKFIIAPHELHEEGIQWIEKNVTRKCIRYSKLNETNASSYNVLIIDNIGMLSSLYQYGDFGYIGGAFGKGLHNILEAASFGMPIFFGPNFKKFREAVELVKLNCAFPVNKPDEVIEKFSEFYKDESKRLEVAENSRQFVFFNTGATEIILNYVKQIIPRQ